jgi:inner membrane protein
VLDGLEPHWAWLIAGLVLAVAEMVVPGVFLIWFAAAALIVGLLTAVLPIGAAVQVVLFVVLSLASVLASRRFLRRYPVQSADPLLNQRGAQLVGRQVVVTQAIEGGSGRVRCGDSEWLASGPDAQAGARMTVTGSQGSVLIVEAVP